MSHRSRTARAYQGSLKPQPHTSGETAWNTSPDAHTNSHHYAFEQRNDDHVDLLGNKITELKQISLQIGEEVTYQLGALRDMENDFEKSGGLLGATMRRLKIMARTQNGRWMWYLIFFVLAVFLYIYLFRYKK
ncbi:uncharacterized protein SPPG_08963 [Spizellomyces punctatus DAOM BR117]|uniref:t-SNARE coiled-coil homology domain-containing protein n=1 Tax=Spizellomyces punctatus (strain DAOM BR117) TaxID=645134 RepID=A0A0L0HNV0_SPIPD|nr:uncharacterized protein SPPG_08963 [Spizellomyces punctatus DAOM BR117]KND02772.1 hypothetical protein SPPG_08963 [Spizellomyces punctatus DAOM BR117]|eukprot:XP_016610811.1 hypothetical protein SPPG_08963 [Spizellomyces punctatus DAOM BR117]